MPSKMQSPRTSLEKITPPVIDVTAMVPLDIIQSDDVVDGALKSQGLIKMSASSLRELRQIGVHINGLGILRTEQGGIFVNRSRMEAMMQAILERTVSGKKPSVKNLAVLARNLALLGGKVTECSKVTLESAGVRMGHAAPNGDSDKPKNKSFAPGVNVFVNAGPNASVKVEEQKVVAEKPLTP